MYLKKVSPEDAGEHGRSLLQDLADAKNHGQRERALNRFENFVARHKPEFYDDDVRTLLTGEVSD